MLSDADEPLPQGLHQSGRMEVSVFSIVRLQSRVDVALGYFEGDLSRCCTAVFHRFFDYIILVTIFANCIALAVQTPFPNGDSNHINQILVRKQTVIITTISHNFTNYSKPLTLTKKHWIFLNSIF